MALFSGLQTPQITDPQNRAKQGSGNLGRGILQVLMMQNEAAGAAAKAGEAKAAQEAGNARVGQVANEVSQLRNSGKDTLAVMDVFRKNGDLFNNPVTRPGMISLAANEKATEDMISGFEKAKIDTIQKKTQSALLTQQIDMASKIAASGGKGSQAIASMFVPNEEGIMPVSDLSNFNTVSGLFAEHVPDAAAKPSSPLGKLLSDRAVAKAAGRTDEVSAFDAEIAIRGAREGMVIQIDDEGNTRISHSPTETITEKFPATEAEPAKSASKGIFGIGAHPAKAAVPATPERTVTRKVRAGESGSPKTKAQRANELSIAHPDWTREQVIEAVNREMP